MSLREPLFLLALAVLPIGALLYWRQERAGRGRGRESFAAPALLAAVAPATPRWRRHVPIAFYALAVAVLALALTRPHVTRAVAVDEARVILVTDSSGSMQAKDVPPSRMVAVKRSGGRFLDRLPKRVQVGAIAFNQLPRVLQVPTRDRETVREALQELEPSGGTATGDALALGLRLATRTGIVGGKRPPAAIVLISDGASVRGVDPIPVARRAGRAKVPVYTIALGTQTGTIEVKRKDGTTQTRRVPPDEPSLRRIAAASGGRSFAAVDEQALDTIYDRLGTQVSKRKEPREITAGVAGGALALVLIGALLSLRWFARVP